MSEANGTSLTASTRPSASTDKEIGSFEFRLGDDARITIEVRASSKAQAVAKAATLAETFMTAARGETPAASQAASIVRSMVPAKATSALKVAGRLAAMAISPAKRERLSKLASRLPGPLSSLAKSILG